MDIKVILYQWKTIHCDMAKNLIDDVHIAFIVEQYET